MNPINWNETYTNISPKLLGICRRYIKDISTAEDIVQDSFIVAIQKENSLKDKNALNGWLSRIVINMAIHHIKEAKKINFSTINNDDLIDNNSVMNTLELDNKSTLLASDIDRDDILQAIDSLPEHHKSVFNMYVMDHFSHNDIAKTLEISVGTSKSHLSRARISIQTFLLDKIKEKPVDENKKRRVAIFIFLGFGNSLFASFYQSKFKDFEIIPQKPFSITSKKVTFPNQFIGLTKAFSVGKIAIYAISFLTLINVGYYLSKNDNLKTIKKENQTVIKENQIITTETDSLKIIEISPNIVSEKVAKDKTILIKKDEIENRKTIAKTDEKIIAATKPDSVKTESPKVIVIKKQIIKRDTIYVTK